MKRVFVTGADPRDDISTWSADWHITRLRPVLDQAAARAAQTGKTTPMSFVLPLRASDPLRIFRALQPLFAGNCSYWEQPARQTSLVGAGVALAIQTQGPNRFADAAQAWQDLRDEAVIAYASDRVRDEGRAGPVLFGGFRFDPLSQRADHWQAFPDGLLILPRLLVSQRADRATLTLSYLVRATDNLDSLTHCLGENLAQISTLMAALPELPSVIPLAEQDAAPQDVMPAARWKGLVDHTVDAIRQGTYAKVVLAREARVLATERPFSLAATLHCLRQSYPSAQVFAVQRGEQAFLGATPERLVHAQDGKVHTMALAGSAPRGTTEEEDQRLGLALLESQKNREEHEIVTATVRNSLAHLCSRLWVADTPKILRLKNIQHLQTSIVGELLPERSVLEALQTLHPTPAVGGAPTEAALAFIRAQENMDRGWYAGPLGWVDLHGNGEFAVALRSALLEPGQATLFAGCGIVKDSDPEAEYAESCLKLQVISRSLSGEE